MPIRIVVRTRTVQTRRPSHARARLQALGIGLPVIAALGLVLSLWIFEVPRFQDLGTLRGDVVRVELIHPRRGSDFGRVVLDTGETLLVPRVRAIPGAREGIEALRPREPVTAWIEPHELERPHTHIAWQLDHQGQTIFEFGDVIGPLERERGRFRIFCWVVLVGGAAALVAGTVRRPA